jgi:hydroxymethylpyrimidine/phosphomethylpyrimidine kinase
VTVTGTDYVRSVEFYRRLGLKLIVDSPENGYARFETAGGVTFSVQIDPEETISATTAIYFECEDLDERVEQLARSGIPFEHGPRNQPWMWREARLRDPDGNIIFFYKAGENRRFPPWRKTD